MPPSRGRTARLTGVIRPAACPRSPPSARHVSSAIHPAFRRPLGTSTRQSKARWAGTLRTSARNITGRDGNPTQQRQLLVGQRTAGQLVPELEELAMDFADAIGKLKPAVPVRQSGLSAVGWPALGSWIIGKHQKAMSPRLSTCIFQVVSTDPARLVLLQRPALALALERRPVHAVQLHELLRHLERLLGHRVLPLPVGRTRGWESTFRRRGEANGLTPVLSTQPSIDRADYRSSRPCTSHMRRRRLHMPAELP